MNIPKATSSYRMDRSCAPVSDNPATVRSSIICGILLALNQACWAQELSVEDRACIKREAQLRALAEGCGLASDDYVAVI